MIEYFLMRLKEERRQETIQHYYAETLRLINKSIAKRLGGQYFDKSLHDILERVSTPPAKRKSAEETIAEITKKAGLVAK